MSTAQSQRALVSCPKRGGKEAVMVSLRGSFVKSQRGWSRQSRATACSQVFGCAETLCCDDVFCLYTCTTKATNSVPCVLVTNGCDRWY